MVKMRIKEKRQWVNALRSGTYEQGENFLLTSKPEHGNVYCCLGVFAAMKQLPYYIESEDIGGTYFRFVFPGLQTENELLEPNWFASYFKGKFDIKEIDEIQSILSKMNDSGEYTFNNIADWIEGNL